MVWGGMIAPLAFNVARGIESGAVPRGYTRPAGRGAWTAGENHGNMNNAVPGGKPETALKLNCAARRRARANGATSPFYEIASEPSSRRYV